MARVHLPTGLQPYLKSVTQPPTAPVGGCAPSPIVVPAAVLNAAPPPVPPVLSPAVLNFPSLLYAPHVPPVAPVSVPVQFVPAWQQRALLGIVAVLSGAVILLAAAVARGQDMCSVKDIARSVLVETASATPRPSEVPSTVAPVRSQRPSRARSAPVRSSPLRQEPMGVLYLIAALIGMAVGRRSVRRSQLVEEVPNAPKALALRPMLGAASITGAVRTNNQDRVLVKTIAGLDTIDVADGLGGLPHGGEAAELAVTYARERLEAELPAVAAAGEHAVRSLLLETVWGAARRLACEAATRNWLNDEGGLRTTLILVVASSDLYVAVWIGDGGVDVLRADGSITQVLAPHKQPATPDLLEASLGPVTEGRPAWAIAKRLPGDVLAVSTDGVADTMGPTLAGIIGEELAHAEGDAAAAATSVVERLASLRGEGGDAIYTDNLTLALLRTGEGRP